MSFSPSSPVMELRRISKRYGPVQVLGDVSLGIHAGEVHVLAGENGAGKSTLMKILAGVIAHDSGQILARGQRVTLRSPAAARSYGIGLVSQELSLVPARSVADNFCLGNERRRTFGRVDMKRANREAREALRELGLEIDPRMPVGELSTGQQQLVEIARVLATSPNVLILDEPTAALSEHEAVLFRGVVRRLRARGMAIVFISHRMAEVEELADRVTVLRDGVVAATFSGAIPIDRVVASMVGRELRDVFGHRPAPAGPVRVRVRGLTDDTRVKPCTLHIRRGEVVTLAGLIGAGRSELAMMLCGARRASAGSIVVDDVEIRPRSVRAALDSGITMLYESRKEQGLFLERSIADNIAMSHLGEHALFGMLRRWRLKQHAEGHMHSLGIRAAGCHQPVGQLSGGNQQKVLLSRCIALRPRVLILDEPTRGVDIGAKVEIYDAINRAAADGAAVLVVSSELPEVIGLSDRILVMRDGTLVADLDNGARTVTEEQIMHHATGLRAGKAYRRSI
ncbi:ribose import ATP-binding protein RbsA (plasmid) [Paraburkholderia terrae]|uniref:Ribose import ATP-binding protein RbsA n=1 Tax=Paraburkholderia terrae TaxID=311230 RepID=A0ABM7U2V8_9BURK|nr:sugar ABC transporter ATP-binding protein [Paraburkholderia terrae]BCZ85598.1 ribose import ATP-binding protein RbsA [Paraburkholderia terrae]